MKTLYEILEVSEKASKEIIEKAYKVLAKKYHPDLQQENERKNAEEQMKQINEAYEILSDDNKRKQYDEELALKREEEQNKSPKVQETNYEFANQNNQNQQTQNNVYATEKNEKANTEYTQTYNNENIKYTKQQIENEYRKKQQELQKEYEMQYQQAYEDYLRSLGYKIKYKWTWKRIKELLKTLAIILIIAVIAWVFPPTHKIIINFYESNEIIKMFIDIIIEIFRSIWQAICGLFK